MFFLLFNTNDQPILQAKINQQVDYNWSAKRTCSLDCSNMSNCYQGIYYLLMIIYLSFLLFQGQNKNLSIFLAFFVFSYHFKNLCSNFYFFFLFIHFIYFSQKINYLLSFHDLFVILLFSLLKIL